MSDRLTAAQARELAGPTVDERVDAALIDIRAAADRKQREVFLHGDFWVHGGYSETADYKAARKMLQDLGYTVEFFYEERQFVNMYTVVKW